MGRLTAILVALAGLAVSAHAQVAVQAHVVDGKPVIAVVPEGAGPFPVVYALPGLGEMVRGPTASARGWVDDYGLVAAYQDIALKGLVIVCPATPRALTGDFERYLLQSVIPWAEAQLPIRKGPKHRGIDGISMGGRHALRIGFKYPEQFATIGTEQAAVGSLAPRWARRIRKRPQRFAHLRVLLLTSNRDGFRRKIERAHRTLKAAGLNVEYQEAIGRHDKVFARGPGARGMLLFHDRALRLTPAPPGSR